LNVWKSLTWHRLWGAAILCLALVAAGCGPAPLGTGWPAISLMTTACGGTSTENIVVSFNDRIVMVNPADGKGVTLLNSDCEPRPPADNGTPRVWDFRGAAANLFFVPPLKLDDDTLLIAGYNQHIYRIDYANARADDADGAPVQGRTGHTVAELVASPDGDLLYLGLNSKDLVALDSSDFSVVWTIPTEHGVWSKPLIVDGTIYFTSLDHHLYAADAESGDLRWKLDLEGAVTSTPLLANDHLFVGSFGRKIFEIDLNGQIINQYATEDWVWGTPTIVDGVMYAADLVGNVYALDVNNNLSEIWKAKVASRAIRPTPVVTDDFVIVASRDHKVYWLNRDDGTIATDREGQPIVREVTAEILSDILLIQPSESVDIPEPYIVVGTLSTSEALVAYALDNGQYVWTYAFS
jgi:outer membrane protein assembly factor BamB